MHKLLCLLFLTLAACSNVSELGDIQGEWTINKELASAPIVGISDEETAELIGDKLSISEREILFQNQSCDYTRIEKNEQTIAEFLQFYSLDTNTKLPDGTSVFSIDCEGSMAIKHLLNNKDKLWLIWYGVLYTITCQIAYLTPPFGYNLFLMRAFAPAEISMGDIYKSVTPFVLVMVATLALIMAVPDLALWLPNLLYPN